LSPEETNRCSRFRAPRGHLNLRRSRAGPGGPPSRLRKHRFIRPISTYLARLRQALTPRLVQFRRSVSPSSERRRRLLRNREVPRRNNAIGRHRLGSNKACRRLRRPPRGPAATARRYRGARSPTGIHLL